MKLTKGELANGWTVESLRAYQRERDNSFANYNPNGTLKSYTGSLVAGNVVTEFNRGRPAISIEGPRGYSPFTRQVR